MSYPVTFWISFAANLSCLLCSLLVLYYLLFDRTLRHALNNHIIILLLFVGVLSTLRYLATTIYQFAFGSSAFETVLSYLIAFYFYYGLYSTQIILVVWATIERYILIFHNQWVSTRKKRLFVHYLPTMAVLIYCLVYYALITFSPFCGNSYGDVISGDFSSPCALNNPVVLIWEILFHHIIATLIIGIFSIALIVRIVRQKRRLNQQMQWRKHRKMTIQMIFTSVFYLICDGPWAILAYSIQHGVPFDSVVATLLTYAFYLRDYVTYLYPFICLVSLSELRSKLKQMFLCRRHQRRVAPQK